MVHQKMKIVSLCVPSCRTKLYDSLFSFWSHSFKMTEVRILSTPLNKLPKHTVCSSKFYYQDFIDQKIAIQTPVHHHRSGCNVPFGYNRSMHNDGFNCMWKKNNPGHKTKHTILFTFSLFLHSVWLAYFDNTFKAGKQNINGQTLQ